VKSYQFRNRFNDFGPGRIITLLPPWPFFKGEQQMSQRVKRTGLAALFIVIVILVTLALGFFIMRTAKAQAPRSYHSGWQLVRETANEDGASFAAVYDITGVSSTIANSQFADKDTSTVVKGGAFYVPPASTEWGDGTSPGNKWMFVFCGEARNGGDDTFSFNLIGWAKNNGMLQNICEGSATLGTAAVIVFPDGGDALAPTFNETGVTYTHATKTFTDTSDTGSFDGAVAGMIVRVTGSNLTSEMATITTVTDANIIICSGVTSTNNNTDSTVQGPVHFWADTISLDEQSKWPNYNGTLGLPGVAVHNSADNEVAILNVDLAGIEWIQFVVYDADGATGEEAGNVTVYGRRY